MRCDDCGSDCCVGATFELVKVRDGVRPSVLVWLAPRGPFPDFDFFPPAIWL